MLEKNPMRLTKTASQRINRFAALGFAALMLITAVLTSAPVPAQAAPLAQAFPGTVNWADKPSIISNGARSGFPRVTVDANNVTHVIYATEKGDIVYTNNNGGSFNIGGKTLTSGSYGTVPNVDIEAGPNNTIHVMYSRVGNNNKVYYRRSTDGGNSWQGQIELSGYKAFSPDLAVDPQGNAHMVWIDNRCGEYNVFYRMMSASGNLSGTQQPRSECGTYQNRPSITYAGGRVHLVYQRGTSSGAEIFYTSLGNNWSTPKSISNTSTASQNPTITSDGNNALFMAWDENVNGHDILFKASLDGGNTWSNAIAFSNTSAWASHPHATWSPQARRVHVVWADMTGQSEEEVWERQFDPESLNTTAADRISHTGRKSLWPAVAVGTSRADIVWHDNSNTTYQIWNDYGQVVAGYDSGCNGTLNLTGQILGGTKYTKSSTLTGVITPEANCTPQRMQISVNTPITESTPIVSYNANISVPAVGNCLQTVYVRLFRGNFGKDIIQDTVVVDGEVTANIQASNPHLPNLPVLSSSQPGVQNGSVLYTRDTQFLLNISGNDCAGLSTFQVGSVNGSINNNTYQGHVSIPNPNQQSKQPLNIVVNDKAGNSKTINSFIIHDQGAPVMTSATGTAPASTSISNIALKFTNVSVTDDWFGYEEGLPVNNRFWGVAIANSTSNVAITDPSLKWTGVKVENPASSFEVMWNLVNGFATTPNPNQPHDIYVYVRFIDGAGNMSANGVSLGKVTLNEGYVNPTMHLPIVTLGN
jgi:hypothetical protein